MSTTQSGPRSIRPLAYGLGGALAVATGVSLVLPGRESLISAGPIVEGHAEIGCGDCHTDAPGTTRQQLQANARHLLGMRDQRAAFVHAAIHNDDCQACHAYEGDAHPPYRFSEPRFAEVRAILGPTRCVSCHVEHTGRRVSVSATMCRHCHEDMDLKGDPIEPSHASLTRDEAWDTCMRCHDFHGNHTQETPTDMSNGASIEEVHAYLEGGTSPYGEDLRYRARHTRQDHDLGGTE